MATGRADEVCEVGVEDDEDEDEDEDVDVDVDVEADVGTDDEVDDVSGSSRRCLGGGQVTVTVSFDVSGACTEWPSSATDKEVEAKGT